MQAHAKRDAYPGHDYENLMSGVDAVIAQGYVDKDNLFVTGGSGGGVVTAWIIGKTGRFRATVVSKPVINWFRLVLVNGSCRATLFCTQERQLNKSPQWGGEVKALLTTTSLG